MMRLENEQQSLYETHLKSNIEQSTATRFRNPDDHEQNNEKVERRLQFRTFVAEKVRDSQMLRELDEQSFHLTYLQKINKLREERERLKRESQHNKVVFSRGETREPPHRASVHSPSLINSYLYQSQKISPIKKAANYHVSYNENDDKTLHPSMESSITLKEQEKPNIIEQQSKQPSKEGSPIKINMFSNRQIEKNMKDKQNNNLASPYFQNHSIQNQIYEKKVQQFNEEAVEKRQITVNYESDYQHDHEIGGRNNNYKLQNKGQQLIKIEEDDLQQSQISIKQKTKVKKSKYKKITTSKQTQDKALKRIKNRVELSRRLHEDAQHRSQTFEKTHLKMKYQNEERQRKEVLVKMCCQKPIIDRYGYLMLGMY